MLSWTQKSPNLAVQAPERVVSSTNMSNLAKNWLQFAQNRVARPTSVTNSALQLVIVAMPIDCAHYTLCMYLLLMRTTALVHVQVKVVDSICPSCMTMHRDARPYARAGYDIVLLELQLPRAHAQGIKQLVLSVVCRLLSVICRRHKNRQISTSRHLCVL